MSLASTSSFAKRAESRAVRIAQMQLASTNMDKLLGSDKEDAKPCKKQKVADEALTINPCTPIGISWEYDTDDELVPRKVYRKL